MTANEIITAAYDKIGIFNTQTDDLSDGLTALDNMLQLWGIEFLTPSVIRESFPLVSGTTDYTIGSGGDFDTTRPIRLLGAFIRDSGTDYPLTVMRDEEYNQELLKSNSEMPDKVYYLSEYPLGKILFNDAPDDTYTCYFEFAKNFSRYTALTDSVSLPAEYNEPIICNLAIRLAVNNTMEVPATVAALAEAGRMLIARLSISNDVRLGIRTPLSSVEQAEYKGSSGYRVFSAK